MSKPRINPLSISSFLVEIYFNEILLSTATAFAYKYGDRKYLVTNYHVAYGRNPITNQCMDPNAAIPNRLKIIYHDKNATSMFCEINYPEYEIPFKYIKRDEQIVDIAIYEMPPEFTGVCINELEQIFPEIHYEENIQLEITEPLYVLGYPRGINICYTPIWKKSSIASEPELKIDGIPCFYIDTTTRQGMSGSPVIFYSSDGNYKTVNGTHHLSGSVTYNFIGIYSGRDRNDESHIAQLGKVWKKELIDDVING